MLGKHSDLDSALERRENASSVPLGAATPAEAQLSWNFALDLWLAADLLCLGATILVPSLVAHRGEGVSGVPLSVGLGWIGSFALLSWYHRSIQSLVIRTDRLRQAHIDWVKASVFTLLGTFLIGDLAELSRLAAVVTFIAGVAMICLVGAAARSTIGRLSRKGTLGERIAIYGRTDRTDALVQLIERGRGPVAKVHAIFDQRNRCATGAAENISAGHDINDFIADIKRQKIDTVIIDLPWSAVTRIDDLVNCLEQISVNISMAPVLLELDRASQSIAYVGGRPTLALYRRRITGLQAIGKVLLDRILAALALLTALIPLLLIALIIKLDSPGPVLFRQKRRGMNNEPFDMLKFRSMHAANTDANADKLVSKGDSRVTRVGAMLRRTSIDELPQLVNVLLGQMSLVGPRPHAYGAKAANRLYEEVVKRYPARHRVLPGITGLAQVRGFRGNTTAERDIINRVESDIEYIDRWTLALDVQIILKTAATFLFQSGAY